MKFRGCCIINNEIYLNFSDDNPRNCGISKQHTVESINNELLSDIRFALIKTLHSKRLYEKHKNELNPDLYVTKDIIELYYLGENNG